MLWKLIGVFVGGIVVDLLITKYTRCVAGSRAKSAAALSGLITLGNLAIWGTILQDAENLGVYGALSMALGASIGTLLGFPHHRAAAVATPEEPAPRVAPPQPIVRAPAPVPAARAPTATHGSVGVPSSLAQVS